MPEILHESVAHIDRGRRGPERREALPRIEPRARTDKSLDQIFSHCAIFFCIASGLELARQDTPAERRIAESAGHEDSVAGTRSIASQHSTSGLAENRDGDRKLARTRNIAAHDIGRSFARRVAEA